MASDKLFAVVRADTTLLCASCADLRYHGDYPDDCTPVFEDDDWKLSVGGLCAECKAFVGAG